jgi:hypothetical protein
MDQAMFNDGAQRVAGGPGLGWRMALNRLMTGLLLPLLVRPAAADKPPPG